MNRSKHGGVLCCALVATLVAPANAEDGDVAEYRAQAIRVIEGSATMFKQEKGWLFSSMGPVGKDGIPSVIEQGDVVSVNGETLQANLIIVSVYHADMKWQGEYLARKGDVRCLVVESEHDIPGDKEENRLWINVEKCMPLG